MKKAGIKLTNCYVKLIFKLALKLGTSQKSSEIENSKNLPVTIATNQIAGLAVN